MNLTHAYGKARERRWQTTSRARSAPMTLSADVRARLQVPDEPGEFGRALSDTAALRETRAGRPE